MRTIAVRCRRCGHEFREQILDPEEARDPNRPTSQLRCERCGSTELDT